MPPTVIAQLPQILAKIIPVATQAVKVLSTKLPLIIDKIKPIADTIWKVSQVMEVYKNTSSVEDLGDKAIQAEQQGVTLDSCMGDFEAYQNKIDNFNLDPQKSTTISNEEKLSASLVLMTIELEKKYSSDISGIFGLIHRNNEFFTPDRISKYLTACEKGHVSISDICNYFSSNLDRKDSTLVETNLVEIEKELQSKNSESEVISTIRDKRE